MLPHVKIHCVKPGMPRIWALVYSTAHCGDKQLCNQQAIRGQGQSVRFEAYLFYRCAKDGKRAKGEWAKIYSQWKNTGKHQIVVGGDLSRKWNMWNKIYFVGGEIRTVASLSSSME